MEKKIRLEILNFSLNTRDSSLLISEKCTENGKNRDSCWVQSEREIERGLLGCHVAEEVKEAS
jgi:hypothetical protein